MCKMVVVSGYQGSLVMGFSMAFSLHLMDEDDDDHLSSTSFHLVKFPPFFSCPFDLICGWGYGPAPFFFQCAVPQLHAKNFVG